MNRILLISNFLLITLCILLACVLYLSSPYSSYFSFFYPRWEMKENNYFTVNYEDAYLYASLDESNNFDVNFYVTNNLTWESTYEKKENVSKAILTVFDDDISISYKNLNTDGVFETKLVLNKDEFLKYKLKNIEWELIEKKPRAK